MTQQQDLPSAEVATVTPLPTVGVPQLPPIAQPAPGAMMQQQANQATMVEQARVVAEVQGRIMVAQACPRSMTLAVQRMEEACSQPALAERAFFRYSRGGGQITGPSVHLARELARCFGNLDYGIAELRRDDRTGESEMKAWAWDIETNTRPETTFIVKHGRDTKDGVKALTDLRDIYENNANSGARRLREMIFAILPKWFTERAIELCHATIEADGAEQPLPQRIASMISRFGDNAGVTAEQLERKIGRRRESWTSHDLAALKVIGTSLARGETTADDEFGESQAAGAEILAQRAQRQQARALVAPAAPEVAEPAAAKKAAAGKAATSQPEPALCPGGCGATLDQCGPECCPGASS